MIELKEVSKRYGDVEALKSISLGLRRGETLTIVGPNGSGKTTLLKILAALERPTSGEVFFDGVRIDESNSARFRQKSTMVFQRNIVLGGSVYENTAYGLRLLDLSKAEMNRRIRETLEVVGLNGMERRNARRLSGGEQQRLSLARALALDRNLLLLDEPTANLDPESFSVVKETIAQLGHDREKTIVMATHNLLHVEELSDRLVLLDRGEIIEAGPPSTLLLTPSTEMARFARTENVFTGLSRAVEGISYIDIGGDVEVKAAFESSGRIAIHIRPEDIILSKDWVETSARNEFRGSIIAVEDLGPVVRLRVDVGRIFTIQITGKSFMEMGLNLGSELYISFKASAVQQIKRA